MRRDKGEEQNVKGAPEYDGSLIVGKEEKKED